MRCVRWHCQRQRTASVQLATSEYASRKDRPAAVSTYLFISFILFIFIDLYLFLPAMLAWDVMQSPPSSVRLFPCHVSNWLTLIFCVCMGHYHGLQGIETEGHRSRSRLGWSDLNPRLRTGFWLFIFIYLFFYLFFYFYWLIDIYSFAPVNLDWFHLPGFTFLVPAHLVVPDKIRKTVVCVCLCDLLLLILKMIFDNRDTSIRWHDLSTTAKQVVVVWACVVKRRQWLGDENCMEYEVDGFRPRGRPNRTWREVEFNGRTTKYNTKAIGTYRHQVQCNTMTQFTTYKTRKIFLKL